MALVYGKDALVTRWVADQLGLTRVPESYSSIGWESNGELTAGVFFDGCTETNVFAHIAAAAPMSPGFLAAVGAFAYEQLGCDRMTFQVHDDNLACIRFVVSMGARLEATLRGAHARGDVLLFVLWRDNSLYARLKEHRPDEVAA